MKKILVLSGFFCLCLWNTSSAQTNANENGTGTPVSASKDVIVTGTAVIEKTDSTGASAPMDKSSSGPIISAPADTKQSAGSDKISSGKKPR